MTPAARVVMSAAPLTGCVPRTAAEVEWLDEERETAGWDESTVAWCLGPETAERARGLGWRRIRELPAGLDSAGVVTWIAKHRSRRTS